MSDWWIRPMIMGIYMKVRNTNYKVIAFCERRITMKGRLQSLKWSSALAFVTVAIVLGSLALARITMSQDCMPFIGVPISDQSLEWQSYGERYAIIVMGGDVTGQMYRWYWGDTYGMYAELKTHDFTDDNIYFLSYGDSAEAHSDIVDATSTTGNITTAYQ